MADTPEATPLAAGPNVDPPKQTSVFRLFAASLGIYMLTLFLSYLFEEFALNGVVDGIVNSFEKSIFYVMIFGLAWLLNIFPLNLLVLGLYRWRRWRKYRTQFVLGPSLCIFGISMLLEVFNWPTAHQLFKVETGVPLPDSAQDLRSSGEHTAMGQIRDTFYFRCNPHDTEKLIQAMHLDEDNTGFGNSPIERPKPDWPDPRTWKGRRVYTHSDAKNWVFYNLVTDENQNQVYVYIME